MRDSFGILSVIAGIDAVMLELQFFDDQLVQISFILYYQYAHERASFVGV